VTRIACHLQEFTIATICTRQQSDGSLRYTAIVRLRKGKDLIHQEAKTFSHRRAAGKWAKTREQAQLEFLEKHAIGKSNVFSLTPAILIDHIRARRTAGAGPATVGMI
jgi:hypothetical protein